MSSFGPSLKMRSMAASHLSDRVEVQTPIVSVPVRVGDGDYLTDSSGGYLTAENTSRLYTLSASSRAMQEGGGLFGDPIPFNALIRQQAASSQDDVTVDRVVRDLTVWLDDVAGTVRAGDRMTVVGCGDVSLVGEWGTVLTVDRDSLRAVRRCTVRLSNDG